MANELDCKCDDGHIVAARIKQSENGKWAIYCPIVNNSGVEFYDVSLYSDTYDRAVIFNSTIGVGYIAVCKNNLWGLIQIRWLKALEHPENKPEYILSILREPSDKDPKIFFGRDFKMIEPIVHEDLDTMLEKHLLTGTRQWRRYETPDENEHWSDQAIAETYRTFEDLRCLNPCPMKHWRQEKNFGGIYVNDIMNHKWIIHISDSPTDETEEFASMEEMIKSGWVVD